jgi:pilus assembly protein CpaF
MNVEVSLRVPGEAWEPYLLLSGRDALSIGRDPSCAVCLPGKSVSRQHARVLVTASGLRVEDLSVNGTRAAGLPLQPGPHELPDGTALGIGDFELRIVPQRTREAGAHDSPIAAGGRVVEPSSSAFGQGPAQRQGEAPAEPPAGAPAPPRSEVPVALRREMHRRLLEHLDLNDVAAARFDDPLFRPRVLTALRRVMEAVAERLVGVDQEQLLGELAEEALGLGPLEALLADDSVSEIMVVGADTIYVERAGKLQKTSARFTDDDRVRAVIERIITPLGRRIDEASPLVDARLPDGSRVNAVIPPLSLRGPSITIRKFPKKQLTMGELVGLGTLDARMARFLERSVQARKNVVVSGGTGSGKTTLLNALSGAIPADERIVTIEDAAELRLLQPHVVSLETRPANLEGQGQYTIRDLVRNALRMRPDRIVVGECRGPEALDMLQAMNTGHDGSLTTLHANSPREALQRLETLVLMAGLDLPARAIREQLASSLQLIVQQCRLADGTRKIVEIAEVRGFDEAGAIRIDTIYAYQRRGTAADGRVLGGFARTGYLPSFLMDFQVRGLLQPGEPVL